MTPLQRAMFALKETQDRLEALQQRLSEPIAIVGMACRFPGGANDPSSYWRLLCDGVDAIRETPPGRWNADFFYDPDPTVPGKMNTRCGGFLDRIDEFDNHFFGISDREAARIDPQHRMLLELAWEALEDAGVPPTSLRGQKVGAFIGISLSDYGMLLADDLTQTDAHAVTGTSLCLAANRLSFVFGWQGPSLALDTACSSSLVAVHLACQHIRTGECEMAVAGGTSVLLSPLGTINLTKAGFCAADGRVRAFDASASGYVRGEGTGLVVLKRLSAALQNGDPIYAVIRGSAVNQNGGSNGLTAPSGAAQEAVLREAYVRAGVSPGQIQYVETQGTGTRLGDAIEALALGSVLQRDRARWKPLQHRLGENQYRPSGGRGGCGEPDQSGLVAEARTAAAHLALPDAEPRHSVRPTAVAGPAAAGTLAEIVRSRGWRGSARSVSAAATPTWSCRSPRLRRRPRCRPRRSPGRVCCCCRRARNVPCAALAERYVEFLSHDPPAWSDVCYTAAQRRDHHDCRLAVLADSPARALAALGGFLRGEPAAGVWIGRKPFGRDLKTAFVYGDDKNQLPQRLRLAALIPGISSAVEQLDAALQRVLGQSWAGLLQMDPECPDPAQVRIARLALQLAMTDWWVGIGVVPQVVLGQGVGELAAACAAGILTRDAALHVLAASDTQRGALLNGFTPQPAALPFVSAMDGQTHRGPDLADAHWRSCLEGSAGWAEAVGNLRQRQVGRVPGGRHR